MEGQPTQNLRAFENRRIEKILSYSQLAIDLQFGIKLLNRYLSEVEMAASGVPYSQIGFSARREESGQVHVITASGQTITDPYLIRNPSLTPPGSKAVLRLSGMMTAEDEASSSGIGTLAARLRQAYSNDNIDAVVLETNSGGGEITAMQMMMSAVQERNKPVIGWVHMAASAAYGSVAGTDEIIVSSPLSKVGSIGAVVTIDKTFLEFFKENFVSFYGANAPKKQGEFRSMLEGDFGPMQEMVDEATDQFHAQVRGLRNLSGSESYVKETLNGSMFDAGAAKRRGLIDGVGNLNMAIKRADVWMAMPKYKKQKRA